MHEGRAPRSAFFEARGGKVIANLRAVVVLADLYDPHLCGSHVEVTWIRRHRLRTGRYVGRNGFAYFSYSIAAATMQ